MVLVLLIGLVLLSVAVAAALRAVTIGSGRREDVLAGVAAYGFSGAHSEGRRHVSLSEAVAGLALRVGNRLEPRLAAGAGGPREPQQRRLLPDERRPIPRLPRRLSRRRAVRAARAHPPRQRSRS